MLNPYGKIYGCIGVVVRCQLTEPTRSMGKLACVYRFCANHALNRTFTWKSIRFSTKTTTNNKQQKQQNVSKRSTQNYRLSYPSILIDALVSQFCTQIMNRAFTWKKKKYFTR